MATRLRHGWRTPPPPQMHAPSVSLERGEGKEVAHLKATPSQKQDKKSVIINAVLHRRRERQEKKLYLCTAVQRPRCGPQRLTYISDPQWWVHSEQFGNFQDHGGKREKRFNPGGNDPGGKTELRTLYYPTDEVLLPFVKPGGNGNRTHALLGTKLRLNEATPRVTTIDEIQLQVYGVYRPRIRATDNSGTTGESHSRLLAASFTGWNIVLGWPWLKELNPDINWRDERWSYRGDSQEKPMPQGTSEEKMSFLDAQEFIASSKDDVVHVMHLRPGREGPTEGQSRLWATNEQPIPKAYGDLAGVFSKEKANELPKNS
ncbi:MAG: hypothetical protein M1816_002650 [Peltula sp. TS41687]|nr:MAG: hypothetical protein M1816_002650 [Peltula sp. TS41687]